MNRRAYLELAVRRGLEATEDEHVRQAISDFTDQAFPHYRDKELNVDRRYEILRCQRQIIGAAVGELASRQVIIDLDSCLNGGRDLLSVNQIGKEAANNKCPTASPMLENLLQVQYSRFLPAYMQVFGEAKGGVTPYAAILSVGNEMQGEYLSTQEEWLRHSNQPLAKVRREFYAKDGSGLNSELESDLLDSVFRNIKQAIAMCIGKGIAHDRSGLTCSKREFVSGQFAEMSSISSVTNSVSRPIFNNYDTLLEHYSAWEKGAISQAVFLSVPVVPGLCRPEAHYDKSVQGGRWEAAGHCHADVAYVKQEEFSISPTELLPRLGINSMPSSEISMSHLVLASTLSVADRTIYAHW